MNTKELTDEEWVRSWKEALPKSLLKEENFNELLTNPNLANNKLVSIKYIKSKSTMGLKEAGLYYDLWIENNCR